MGGMRRLRREMERQQFRIEPLRPKEFFGERKMSEVLLEFAEPLVGEAAGELSDEQYEDAIAFAAICWNMSFFPPEEQKKLLDEALDKVCGNDIACRLEFGEVAKALIEQRKMFYPGEKRIVMKYQFLDEGDTRRLQVVSALVK